MGTGGRRPLTRRAAPEPFAERCVKARDRKHSDRRAVQRPSMAIDTIESFLTELGRAELLGSEQIEEIAPRSGTSLR